jgi:hypothetical protein
VPRYIGPDGIGLAFEVERDESLVSENGVDRGDKGSELEAIAERKEWW